MSLTRYCGDINILDHSILGHRFETQPMQSLFSQVKSAAYNIIDRKGYTNTAIGAVIARLAEALLGDKKVSSPSAHA